MEEKVTNQEAFQQKDKTVTNTKLKILKRNNIILKEFEDNKVRPIQIEKQKNLDASPSSNFPSEFSVITKVSNKLCKEVCDNSPNTTLHKVIRNDTTNVLKKTPEGTKDCRKLFESRVKIEMKQKPENANRPRFKFDGFGTPGYSRSENDNNQSVNSGGVHSTCYNCQGLEHMSRECPKLKRERELLMQLICTKCLGRGHSSRDCADLSSNVVADEESNNPETSEKKESRKGMLQKRPSEFSNGSLSLPEKLCFQCKKSGNFGPLIPCDSCSLFFHLYCLDPPLTSPPIGQWECPNHSQHKMSFIDSCAPVQKANCPVYLKKASTVYGNEMNAIVEKQKKRTQCNIVIVTDERENMESFHLSTFNSKVAVFRVPGLNFGNAFENIKKHPNFGKGTLFIFLCGTHDLLNSVLHPDCLTSSCRTPQIMLNLIPYDNHSLLVEKVLKLNMDILLASANDAAIFGGLTPVHIRQYNQFAITKRPCLNIHSSQPNWVVEDVHVGHYISSIKWFNDFAKFHSQTFGFDPWDLESSYFCKVDKSDILLPNGYNLSKNEISGRALRVKALCQEILKRISNDSSLTVQSKMFNMEISADFSASAAEKLPLKSTGQKATTLDSGSDKSRSSLISVPFVPSSSGQPTLPGSASMQSQFPIQSTSQIFFPQSSSFRGSIPPLESIPGQSINSTFMPKPADFPLKYGLSGTVPSPSSIHVQSIINSSYVPQPACFPPLNSFPIQSASSNFMAQPEGFPLRSSLAMSRPIPTLNTLPVTSSIFMPQLGYFPQNSMEMTIPPLNGFPTQSASSIGMPESLPVRSSLARTIPLSHNFTVPPNSSVFISQPSSSPLNSTFASTIPSSEKSLTVQSTNPIFNFLPPSATVKSTSTVSTSTPSSLALSPTNVLPIKSTLDSSL